MRGSATEPRFLFERSAGDFSLRGKKRAGHPVGRPAFFAARRQVAFPTRLRWTRRAQARPVPVLF